MSLERDVAPIAIAGLGPVGSCLTGQDPKADADIVTMWAASLPV